MNARTRKIARLEGSLALLEVKVARLHLRDDLSGQARRDQINKARRKVARLLDRLDAARHPED